MERLLQAMRAVAEPTRLRILNLVAHSELTVSDLVGLLGQSQPRLSRHLKLLVEGGVLARYQEGTWARYRLAGSAADEAGPAAFAGAVLDLLPLDDAVLSRDLERLDRLRRKRDAEAAAYFKRNAEQWDRIRALHVDESALTECLNQVTAGWPLGRLLDIGTGTGKLLEFFGPRATSAVGIDLSADMLRVARAAIERDGLDHCQVRQADMYQIPCGDGDFDTAVLHMVLHYSDDPLQALTEAARALSDDGRIVIVDFARHNLAELRAEHAHRWPGFKDEQIWEWLAGAGFVDTNVTRLEGGALTVCVWTARKAQAEKEAVA
ncbi:MAG: metalloregulator ArsR/SmtB family transcription factor [Alphaproteobacteria bacterium]|uniref:ArsR/SmtB family transcription factor n=1 Tax=Pacificispira sp. TaxID=2888761 RepID=UPI001B189AB5|nr:metalloregulator ArsR/SmtB family transcription factor [Alphaproteobacteria bacterium]MBO6861534.1 metalloregulator ArsR/SmtB family transcription factor [Alphaproteobacteria bacterium]MEC9265472.1 metalloregulator ArsR/SmtB family transcription factor [Pseudomonadota bacterium]